MITLGDTLDPNTPGFDPDFFGAELGAGCIPIDWWAQRARRGELGSACSGFPWPGLGQTFTRKPKSGLSRLFPGGLPFDPGDLATEIAPAVEAEAQRQDQQKRRGLWIGLGVGAGVLAILGGVVVLARR